MQPSFENAHLEIDWSLPPEEIYAAVKAQAAAVYRAWMAEVQARRQGGRGPSSGEKGAGNGAGAGSNSAAA